MYRDFGNNIYIVKSNRTTLPTTNTGQNIHGDTGTHNEKQMDKQKRGEQRQHSHVKKQTSTSQTSVK